ncbi:hypothetical protein EN849_32750, partial [Mesorhizobium sp. M2D.F.Ca.ET.206.01.1.1]
SDATRLAEAAGAADVKVRLEIWQRSGDSDPGDERAPHRPRGGQEGIQSCRLTMAGSLGPAGRRWSPVSSQLRERSARLVRVHYGVLLSASDKILGRRRCIAVPCCSRFAAGK